MKLVGKATVFKSVQYQRKDGSYGCRVQAFTDEGDVVVFYRPAEENPVKDTIYNLALDVDQKFSPVIRFQKAETK